jgi:hypothetical protein
MQHVTQGLPDGGQKSDQPERQPKEKCFLRWRFGLVLGARLVYVQASCVDSSAWPCCCAVTSRRVSAGSVW